MSVISRVVLAGVVCAAMGAQAFAAPTGDEAGSTRDRFFQASKCVVTLGFSGGCDKDQADPKRTDAPAAVTKAADDNSTRHQFANASKCVVSFGFVGSCDKDAPAGSAKASAAGSARADAAPAALDTSTRGQLAHASKCVLTFGFGGNCDKK
jgi:hypothetical protein